MRQLRIFNLRFGIVLTAVGFFCLLISPVRALTVFSPVVELAGEPGEHVNGIVKVYNETAETLSLEGSVESYATEAQQTAVPWIALRQQEVVITPGQAIFIPFTVTIPSRATPGGYYAVIYWQTVGITDEQIAVSSKVGTVVFVRVNGAVIESIEATSIVLYPQRQIYFSYPLTMTVTVENNGTIHTSPVGTVVVGDETILLNATKNYLLPGQQKNFSVLIGPAQSGSWLRDTIDRIQYELTHMRLGTTNIDVRIATTEDATSTKTINFFFIPLYTIGVGIGIVILVVLFFFINRKVNFLKRRTHAK